MSDTVLSSACGVPGGGGVTRRLGLITLCILPLVAAAGPGPAPSFVPTARDQADIGRIENYLNGLRSIKAHFEQVAGNGVRSSGTAWIERPGRLRFEYTPPSPFLLVAGHGLVVFHDSQLKQTSNFPLSSTPLSIVLSDNLKLSGEVTVTGISRPQGAIRLQMVRTASPTDGSETLVFSDNPLSLKGWSVVDSHGQETAVSLSAIQTGGKFDQEMFNLVDPEFLGREPPLFEKSGGNG